MSSANQNTTDQPNQPHIFISYISSDEEWATWIAHQLQCAGYCTFVQAWDIRPGSLTLDALAQAIKQAECTLLLLTPEYLDSSFGKLQWSSAIQQLLATTNRHIIPVLIRPCQHPLFDTFTPLDLIGRNQQQARDTLLAGIRTQFQRPTSVPFPSSLASTFPGAYPRVWMVPLSRNPFFTGQEEILTQISQVLASGATATLTQAITGLGGIGKTQIAVEYAHRAHQNYQAVLWCNADTREALITGYGQMATELNLPERNEPDQQIVAKAVLRWLRTHPRWLFILDNADDLQLLDGFLPPTSGPDHGHILLTTRAQAVGRRAHPIEVSSLSPDLGALLLLRRSGLLSATATLSDAKEHCDFSLALTLATELGGLPLALDQAGAYIEETLCDLASYWQHYQQQRTILLNLRGEQTEQADHPEPVTTTWNISFQRLSERSPIAANLFTFCAYLAPDAIPESILQVAMQAILASSNDADPSMNTSLALDKAIGAVRAFSLLQRDLSGKTVSVHRLVQSIVRDSQPPEVASAMKQWVVWAVDAARPDVTNFAQWSACEQWVSHALVCACWIEEHQIERTESARLLHNAGYYLSDRGRYVETEPLLKRALAISERQLGAEHPETATSLNNLACLYRVQGKYVEAEPLLKRALSIRERQLGAEHPETAASLNNLAGLYESQGKYVEAEPLYQRALSISERQLGAEHPETATSLNNLAGLYYHQGKYVEAEPLYQRALAISERQLGAEHPETATSLNNLAGLYRAQGKYVEAEPLYQRALAIYEGQLGAEHPKTATSLNDLALLYHHQGKYVEAEPLYQRALAIYEGQLGAEHPETATSLNNLAELYRAQGKYGEAEPLLKRALSINERQLGAEHPETATSLNNLAELYRVQGKYVKAEPLYQRSLEIRERQLGAEHPETATSLNNLALLYQSQGKYGEAEPLYRQSATILLSRLGFEHPTAQTVFTNYMYLLKKMGVDGEALMRGNES